MKTNINNVKKITVKASDEYDVLIGSGLLDDVGRLVYERLGDRKLALITDDKVDSLYSDRVIKSLKSVGYTVLKYVFPNGERSKNLATYGKILDFLAKEQFTRTDAVIALGGGVTGDMAGFVAATFLRGVSYVQIPTTLLAQVDSSVGGKTAIDLDSGKNLVGAFKQPSLVVCDTQTLKTLPKEIFIDGMGEVAKYAILDKKVFELISLDNYSIEQLVELCIDYKRRVVEQDEFEGGLRKLLNLGHTPAHGIENLSAYTIAHGRAVAMGLEIILNASLKHALINQSTFNMLKNAVNKCVGANTCPYAIKDIAKCALSDKKRSGDDISLVMVFGIGDCRPIKIKALEMEGYLS
jgi:3-dehydroquinate synthase